MYENISKIVQYKNTITRKYISISDNEIDPLPKEKYWISKKYVMESEPLNENLDWGESEDVEWSKRVLPKYVYMMNKNSKVKLLKDKRLSAEYV